MSTTVRVPLAAAVTRQLPPVCVMTGERAAGYAPVVAKPHALAAALRFALARQRERCIVLLPMSEDAFERWMTHRRRRVWCAYLGLFGIVVAGAVRRMPPLSLALLALSLVSLLTAVGAHLRAPWHQVSTSVDATGRWLTLSGAHERFAEALAARR